MFEGMPPRDIMQLEPKECLRVLVKDELEKIFKACNAFWRHPGEKNPEAPHVVLTSGKHSNLYINTPQVLQWSNLCQIMAMQLVYLLEHYYNGPVDWTTGSDSSALGVSKDVANLLNTRWPLIQKGPKGNIGQRS